MRNLTPGHNTGRPKGFRDGVSVRYRNGTGATQASVATPDADTVALTDARINPTAGLATDYLNRFNESVMLLAMLSSCSEFRDDFLAWEPMSYREHFRFSRFKRAILRLPPTTRPTQTSEIRSIRWP
jgi:hypothetical protein